MKTLSLLLVAVPLFSFAQTKDPGSVDQNSSVDSFDFAEFNRMWRVITGRVEDARTSGNLLTVVEVLRGMEKEFEERGPMAAQVLNLSLMQRSAEIGNYGDAMRYADVGPVPLRASKAVTLRGLGGFAPEDALEGIVARAKGARLVMINEAHHMPQHRAFSLLLLRELKEQGFTHFAAETLSQEDTQLEQRGYPTKASGSYTEEPLYADLVRTAIRLGYKIVAYEPHSFGEDRELGQAQNLIQRSFRIDPDARVLVHAGYQHIDEQGTISGSMALAGRLKEMTGIDPLTIDQTAMSEHSSVKYEHPAYGSLIELHGLVAPTIFRSGEGALFSLSPGIRDITLVHPRSVYKNGRPNWLTMNGLRKHVALPADVCGEHARVLVRAMARSESEAAIPIDQVEVVAGHAIPDLVLPKGTFKIVVHDAQGKLLQKGEIVVP